MLDVREIMKDLIEAVNNENAKDDPLPTIPNPLPAPVIDSDYWYMSDKTLQTV
jgi:hypothetical protein